MIELRFGTRWFFHALLRGGLCLVAGAITAAAQQLPAHLPDVALRKPSTTPLVFTGVTVIDVAHERRLSAQNSCGCREVGTNRPGPTAKSHIPTGARVVNARGKYLIPGLWDMHVHLDAQAPRFYPMLIAHGVTGIREMAQRFPAGADSFRVWQREVMAGTQVGPRAVGPSVDLTEGNGISINTPEDAHRVIDSLKAAGTVFLKYHDDGGDRDLFFAEVREARRAGIPIVGHVPQSVSKAEAADSGMYSIEHVQATCWPNWPAPLGDSVVLDRRCAPVARAYIRNGTWMVPTLATAWPDPTPHRRAAAVFKDELRVVRMMRRFGVRNFLSGTDWAIQYMGPWEPEFRPGLSAAEELVFLVEAGLTPLEALQAATLNPAKFFHATDSLGTVATGKLADLVLLDADPLADIHNVLKVRSVVANGRYFDRFAIDTSGPRRNRQPGRGLVVLEERFEQSRSASFVAGTDTTQVALTEELFTHYLALKKDLKEFWETHAVLLDSARAHADNPVIEVVPKGVKVPGRRIVQVEIFDYVALVSKDTALNGIFKKNDFRPEQFWPTCR